MASSQQMRPDQGHNECMADSDKWMESVKEAAKMDPSDSKEEPSGFLEQTGVQMKSLAQEAAGAMKTAMMKNKKETAADPNGPIPFKPTNDPSFGEYTP